MNKHRYFDTVTGNEASESRAVDRHGVLRDGFTIRVPMRVRDAGSQDAKPLITDGHNPVDPAKGMRPGWRMPTVEDSTKVTKVHDAYRNYETGLVNRYRVGDGVQCAQCYGSGEDEDGGDCPMCKGSGVLPGGNGDDLPDPASDSRTVDQHKQTLDQLYRQRDEELSNAWRQK